MTRGIIFRKVVFVLLLCICVAGSLQGSSRVWDLIIVENDTFYMDRTALTGKQIQLVRKRINNQVGEQGTGSWHEWRVFQSLWRLEQDKLYLEAIRINLSDDPWGTFDLSGIFDAYVKKGRLEASWYSGEFRVLDGELVWPGWLDVLHERETLYTFRKGKVIEKKEFHNSLKKAVLKSTETWYHIFNSRELPWEEDMELIVFVYPREDGSLDSVKVFKEIFQRNRELLSDDSPFVEEVKACVSLIPDWDVLVVDDRIRPVVLRMSECDEARFFVSDTWKAHRYQLDTLMVNSEEYSMLAYLLPLDQRFFITSLREHLKGSFTRENFRGYRARWKLEDNQLFLTEIRNARTNEIIPLSAFDPGNENEAILASWYTGELSVRAGEPVYDLYGVKDVYEKEIVFQLAKGRVVCRAIFDNDVHRGDTVAQNLCDREIETAFREQFPEWKGYEISTRFTIVPRPDGTLANVKYDGISIWKKEEPDNVTTINDLDHPCMKLIREAVKRVPRWEVRIIRGNLQSLEWQTRTRL